MQTPSVEVRLERKKIKNDELIQNDALLYSWSGAWYQLSPERLPLAADRSGCRDPQRPTAKH